MKRSTIFLLICLPLQLGAYQQDSMIQMNFATNLYPATPMKNVQSLTMKLWGYVEGAFSHEEIRTRFLENQDRFTQQLVQLNSMLDILLLSLEEQVHEEPEIVVQAIKDFEYIFDGISGTSERYTFLTQETETNSSIIANYLFGVILEKLKRVLETGQITTPLYAFFFSNRVNHSKLTTPLLPPAYTVPVAPMA